ncbi:hypothetical protein GQ53DRAFT_751276 [Thozetella sp. PMI_491]|nr:hypothetical protein GQ53DRAFT_751276 [Thozetella sp. PMI_491]
METSEPPKKRRVITKTGCITCKIRKVKCDEGRPACKKCVSSGRVCDGYRTLFRNQTSVAGQQHRLLEPKPSSAVQLDINGSETERRFFHTCKSATEAGVALHVHNRSSFWMTGAPRLAYHDDALRHALVALGATYHLMKVQDINAKYALILQRRPKTQFPIEKLELFIVRQYTLAIGKLRGRIAADDPDGAVVALACCLVFVCLENLRSNFRGAIAHLRHGIQIIENTLDVEHLYRQRFLKSPSSTAKPFQTSRLASDEEIWNMVNTYRQLEISEHLFSHAVPLTLLHRLYAATPYDDGSDLPARFTSLEQGYKARVKLNTDVLAFNWKVGKHRDEPGFWQSADIERQHHCLQRRARGIEKKYEAFLALRGEPPLGTRENTSCWLDRMQLKVMQTILEIMPVKGSGFSNINAESYIGNMISFLEKVHHATSAFTRKVDSSLDFTTDGTLIAPICFFFSNSRNREQRIRALNLLETYKVMEGPWDGRCIAKLLQGVSSVDPGIPPPDITPWAQWIENVDIHTRFTSSKIDAE